MPKVPVIPENAPFSAQQRLWLNGFFAGLFAYEETAANLAAAPSPPVPAASLLILFGSQTGTAQNLARRLAKEAAARNIQARVVDAAAFAAVDWKGEVNLFVVTSTYGDGEMPDNACEFWQWLASDAGKALSHLKFSVLGLGDSNYSEFCAAGKRVDARLEQVGAARIHPRTDCDVEFEAPAKRWMEAALQSLLPSGSAPASVAATAPSDAAVPAAAGYGRARPFPAPLLVNRRLNGEGSEKETRHYEFSIDGSGLAYDAGDALGVTPKNCPEVVAGVIQALGFTGDESVPCSESREVSLHEALNRCYDITKPGLELLQAVAPHCPELAALLDPVRKDDLKVWLWGRDILDLLLGAPKARFAPRDFVALLKKLSPRLYSIASSPKAHVGRVHLTINTVRYRSRGRSRKGVCSTFLADRAAAGEPVGVFVQPSHGFKPPERAETPMIMVGPGTGVAPFRGFLHDRRASGAPGRNWLFFGEQRGATDFYYRDELEQMQADGHLTRLTTAFSRDQQEKIYVQRRILEHSAEVWAWLEEGAHFYVCGDASRMAKDVDAALLQVAAQAGGLGPERAADYLGKMRAEKRYQRDVY